MIPIPQPGDEDFELYQFAKMRKARREELAAMLLLKLVETTGGRGQYDIQFNTRAAVEYTDALLAELEKEK